MKLDRRVSLAFASGFLASALALSACGDDAPASVDAGAPDLGPVCTYDGGDEAPLAEPERHTARWAFRPSLNEIANRQGGNAPVPVSPPRRSSTREYPRQRCHAS